MAQRPGAPADWDDAHVINVLRELHEDDPTLGYRFLTDELADVGIIASENRVWRLAAMAGVFASHHRRRGQGPASPGRPCTTTCSRSWTRRAWSGTSSPPPGPTRSG
jgi:hypothetical protein